MTPEQAAEKYAKDHEEQFETEMDTVESDYNKLQSAFLAGHAHAEQERWVLPELIERANLIQDATRREKTTKAIKMAFETYETYKDMLKEFDEILPQPPEHG